MQKTFFYTQIKSNDFNVLKETCQPFSKDIFSADQEHIVAFEQSSFACKAAIKFLNKIYDQSTQHDYKIVLVQGDFIEDRPEELPVRIARSIHQNANPKNLYMTEEILNQIHNSDIVFEQKNAMFVKALQKEIPTFALTRFEDSELHADPTDLFDFSQVDSYSTVAANQIVNTGQPAPKPRDPFESSNTTIELDPVRKKMLDTGKVKPAAVTGPQPAFNKAVTGPQTAYKTPPARPTTPKPETPKSQVKSIAIILVLLVLVTASGLYLAKSKPTPTVAVEKTLPVPQIPSEQVSTTPPPVLGSGPIPPIKQTPPPSQTPQPEPGPQIAYIHIHSAPKGADIWMNGKKTGKKTPLNNLKVATKSPILIEVQKAGYQKASKMLDLTPKETRTIMFQLSAAKAKAAAKKATKKK